MVISATLLACLEKTPGFFTVRLALAQPYSHSLLCQQGWYYQENIGVIINVAADGLRIDVLFQGAFSSTVGAPLTLTGMNINDQLRNMNVPDIVLVPGISTVQALALAQAAAHSWKNSLFLFECAQLPLPICPSLRIVQALPGYVTGNFQWLENLSINGRIASPDAFVVGCYEGSVLEMLQEYLIACDHNHSSERQSCYILPGFPRASLQTLNKLKKVECFYSEYC